MTHKHEKSERIGSRRKLFEIDQAPKRPRLDGVVPSFKFIDLFAGVGGFRLALEANGGRCVFSSEWDPYAQKTYRANFGETPRGDITEIEASEIPQFDILTAGFPCQPFSSIGKRQGFAHRTQGTLFFDVLRIAQARRPAAMLLENVPGLLSHDRGNTWTTILGALQEANYYVFFRILNSADYGVPQYRERVYIVAFDREKIKSPEFGWPRVANREVGIGKFVESGVSDRSISRHLQRVYINKLADGHPQIIDQNSDFPVKTLVASYHKIQRITGTFVKDGPTGLRLLTENECKKIMGFPKSFKFPVSRTQMYRQLGNSVAVPVVRKISEQIVRTLLDSQVIGVEKKSTNRRSKGR